MKTRGVIGHKIVRVNQARECNERTGRTEWVVSSIVLDNGVILYARAWELEGDVGAGIARVGPRKQKEGGAA